jgi:uncharacterized DUF497 family protein
MNENDFEWDEKKAVENYRKHRVTFEVARHVFDDGAAIDEPDYREDYGEARFNIIGMVREHLFFVTYAIRKSKFRLISARRAVPHEKRRYHEKSR